MFFLEVIVNSGVFVELAEMSAPSGSNKVKTRAFHDSCCTWAQVNNDLQAFWGLVILVRRIKHLMTTSHPTQANKTL